MLLESLSIRGLYGALSLDVRFRPDITLLVGINGSGKTSVLNVIDWLLKPDLGRLVLSDYASLSLQFNENEKRYRVRARKTATKLTLSVEGAQAGLKPISVRIAKAPGEEDPDDLNLRLSAERHEIPTFELLRSFSKPTLILLDRTISAESDQIQYVENRRSRVASRPTGQRSPIGYVHDVTSSKYAEFRSKAIANDNELKSQIVMAALQDPEPSLRARAGKPMTREQITRLEEKVSAYLSGTIKSPNVPKQVRRFFKGSRLLTEKEHPAEGQRDLVIDFVTTRYRQIESLAKAFNDFETKNSLAFKSLNDYLLAVNRFLNDSNKSLYFDESSGKLEFAFTGSTQPTRKSRSISNLSSGERQVLILFTFLAFAAKPKGVFIVDEPELSLHPKWQSEFMDEFLKLRPEGTQLLLATHSPDIVGKYKDNCVILRGANRA